MGLWVSQWQGISLLASAFRFSRNNLCLRVCYGLGIEFSEYNIWFLNSKFRCQQWTILMYKYIISNSEGVTLCNVTKLDWRMNCYERDWKKSKWTVTVMYLEWYGIYTCNTRSTVVSKFVFRVFWEVYCPHFEAQRVNQASRVTLKSFILTIEAVCYFEVLQNFYHTLQRHIGEDSTLRSHTARTSSIAYVDLVWQWSAELGKVVLHLSSTWWK